jgi:small subunit ribosomal protein S20
LANTKSAKKRIKVTAKKTLRNKMIKSRTKTAMRKVVMAAQAGDEAAAKTALVNAVKTIDKAASGGVYHKNNAARKKSKLAKMVNGISA